MCRSLFRLAIAAAFVLALALSTVPAQAQPRDLGSGLTTLDTSWIDAALSWLAGLLAGDDAESLYTMDSVTLPPGAGTLGGSCIDPTGNCRPGGGGDV